jgi:hypothetical protein
MKSHVMVMMMMVRAGTSVAQTFQHHDLRGGHIMASCPHISHHVQATWQPRGSLVLRPSLSLHWWSGVGGLSLTNPPQSAHHQQAESILAMRHFDRLILDPLRTVACVVGNHAIIISLYGGSTLEVACHVVWAAESLGIMGNHRPECVMLQ